MLTDDSVMVIQWIILAITYSLMAINEE